MLLLKRNPTDTALNQLLDTAATDPASQTFRTALRDVQPTAAFAQQLEAQLEQLARAQPRAARSTRRWLPIAWHGRRLALTALATLLIVVLAGWLLVRPPESAAAQAVLRRAATVHLAPNQTFHYRYSEQHSDGSHITGMRDVWVQTDASGAITRTAWTLTESRAGSPATVQRAIISGSNNDLQYYGYDLQRNTVTLSSGPGKGDHLFGAQPKPGLNMLLTGPNILDGASVARFLDMITQVNVRGLSLLPAQLLDGVPVIVVRAAPVPGSLIDAHFTAYFDAQRYTLRAFDDSEVRIRLTLEETVPATAVPVDTFLLKPPAGAQVITQAP